MNELKELIAQLHEKQDGKTKLTREIGAIKSKITKMTKSTIQEYIYDNYNQKILSKKDTIEIREFIMDLKGLTKYEKFSNLLKSAGIKYLLFYTDEYYPTFYITNGKGKYDIVNKKTGEIVKSSFAEFSYAKSWAYFLNKNSLEFVENLILIEID